MTFDNVAPPGRHADHGPKSLDALQASVRSARRRYGFDRGPAVALLDTCAEIGELSGAYLKDTAYGASGDASVSSSERIHAEYGDVLFALLGFGDEMGISAGDALSVTLAGYQSRFDTKAPSRSAATVPGVGVELPAEHGPTARKAERGGE